MKSSIRKKFPTGAWRWIMLSMLVSGSCTSQENDKANKTILKEQRYVSINGIDQWITITGNSSKPVVLILHGGPGSPISPYADTVYRNWENDFILVQWDQRGAGKTFGKNAPTEVSAAFWKANPLTVAQITADGIALSEYLLDYLDKQKIMLFGTSWGSVPGIKMVSQRPELFSAYVGHAQIVTPLASLPYTFDRVFQMATNSADASSLAILNVIGPPPYKAAKDFGKFLRVVKKFERENSVPAPQAWWQPGALYASANDEQARSDGDDYSFLNYTGDEKLGINAMMSGIDLQKDNTHFKIPIYLLQGDADLLTPKEITKEYFDRIVAPEKEYVLVADAAHGFNQAVLEAKLSLLKKIVQNQSK